MLAGAGSEGDLERIRMQTQQLYQTTRKKKVACERERDDLRPPRLDIRRDVHVKREKRAAAHATLALHASQRQLSNLHFDLKISFFLVLQTCNVVVSVFFLNLIEINR